MSAPRGSLLALGAAAALAAAPAGASANGLSPAERADRALDRALERLVAADDGPPGAIAIVQRGSERRVHRAGVANDGTGAPLRARDHMRIASTSKAFSGATALSLVQRGVLDLDDTIGDWLPELPAAWHEVTLAQLLQHTSGLPDYTGSEAFAEAVGDSPRTAPPPAALLDFVRTEGLRFPPGSRYRYSNSDNVAVGLIAAAATDRPYAQALRNRVLSPLRLGRTTLPRSVRMPRPYIRGYAVGDGDPADVSQVVAFGGWAWASGGIVSTPDNLNRFIRAYVGGRLFGTVVRRRQYRTVRGHSEPPGPGVNRAGLAVFSYRTRCGTVYGHTGSILGYTQLMAASRDGRRSLTFSINAQLQTADRAQVARLRAAQTAAVCAALART
jgi:D-alanyl-D-alanine carboxypeptidase